MRNFNTKELENIKHNIVPTIFTEHQFNLLIKKLSGQILTNTEKSEFSRSISKKLNAVEKLAGKEDFVYRKEKMLPHRIEQAKTLLKKLKRKFKNKHILITGSFLYKRTYNDIDIFVVSSYDKADYKQNNLHINYITSTDTLFFASISKLCVSNKKTAEGINESPSLDKYISIFQELCNDIFEKRQIKHTLKEFFLYSNFISGQQIPDSKDLHNTYTATHNKNLFRLIKNTFINSVALANLPADAKKDMAQMKDLYKEAAKDNKKHADYYLQMAQAFEEVMDIGV